MAGRGSVKLSIYSTFDDGGTKKAERAMAQFTKKFGDFDADTGKMKLDGVTESLVRQSIEADQSAQKWAKVSDSLSQAGTTMTMFATVPIVAAGAASVKLATDFESSMSRVAGALDDPSVNMQEMSDLALQMGADTIFSASQSGAAMEELAKGGLTAADIKGGALATTMNLAAAGNLELATAANTVVQSMGAFGLTADQSSIAANALAGAATASSSDVADLTQGLSQCSAQANNAGWSIADTTATLAAFSDAGVTGSDAGTSLKTMLQRLAAPTDAAADAINALGINVRDGNGNMLDAAGVAEELQNKLGGLSSAEKDAALQTIFGSDASRAALIMTNQGRVGIEKYTAATNDQTAAQRLAESQMSDGERAIEEMNGALESASIKVGQELIPMVTDGANVVGDAADAFSSLDDETQGTIISIVAATAAIGPMLMVGGKIAGMVSGAYTAYARFTAHLAEFSTRSGAAAKAAGVLNTSVKALSTGLGIFATTAVVNEISKITYGLTDAHKAMSTSVEALATSGDSYTGFGAKVDSAASMVSNMNSVITSSGSTIGDTSAVIAEKEAAITSIIQTALSEQRGLRDEDLEAIRGYNAEIEQLQGEKVGSYQRGMQSIVDSVGMEGQITADQAARDLATVQDYHDQGVADLQRYVDSRRQSLADAYYAEGSMSADEYATETAKLNSYLSENTAAFDQGLSDSQRAIAEHTATATSINQDMLEKMSNARSVFQDAMKLGIGDFGFYLNKDIGSMENATKDMSDVLLSFANETNSTFLGIQLTVSKNGGQITAENAVMIDTLLSQFANLPPELGDAGDKAMRALAEGLDDELGINVANSTADQIIEAYRSKVGVAEGVGGDTSAAYASGFSQHTQDVLNAAAAIVGTSSDELAKAAEQAGVKGDEAVAAYAFALANGATPAQAAAAANAGAASAGFITDGATPGTTGATDYAFAMGGMSWLSQEQAALVAQSGIAGLGSVDATSPGTTFGGQYTFGIGQTDSYAPGASLASNASSGASSIDGSSAGSWFSQGFVGEIGNWLTSAWNAGAALVNAALGGGNAAQQTGSPAKKTKEMMKWFALGYIEEEEHHEPAAYKAGYSLATSSLSGTKRAIEDARLAIPAYNMSDVDMENTTVPIAMSRSAAHRINQTIKHDNRTTLTINNLTISARDVADIKTVEQFSVRVLGMALDSY